MNQIEIFNSPEFGSIRTLEQNGKVLFCGTDVATALGYLHANLPKGTKTLPIAEWEQEYADLKTQRDSDYTKLKDTRAEVAELQKIRKCVDIALRADQPEQTQSRTKRHDIDR